MNRDEILAMEPGRELDALVAEKVMGWTEIDCSEVKWTEFMGRKTPNHMLGPISHYSSEMSAAWEVMETFDANTFNLNWLDRHNSYGEGWHCKLDDAHAHKCGTAPEAICKAALLATLDGQTHG